MAEGDKHLRQCESKKTKVAVLKKNLTLLGLCIGIVAITVLMCSCNNSHMDNESESKQFNNIKRKVSGRIILAIGDSNGVINGGWPKALAAILKEDSVFNHSECGRTIGFDNCGRLSWNTLRNIKSYLEWGLKRSHQKPIDEVIILLGTNDSKACFEKEKDRVAPNLIKLIEKSEILIILMILLRTLRLSHHHHMLRILWLQKKRLAEIIVYVCSYPNFVMWPSNITALMSTFTH